MTAASFITMNWVRITCDWLQHILHGLPNLLEKRRGKMSRWTIKDQKEIILLFKRRLKATSDTHLPWYPHLYPPESVFIEVFSHTREGKIKLHKN